MSSVALSEEGARARFAGDESLSIAAINAPDLCVVSGPQASIDRFEARLRDEEIEHQRLHIRVAAHSSMLEPILAEFRAFCGTIRFAAPRVPFVSNLTGAWITDAEAQTEYWVRHLRHSVRFADGMKALLGQGDRAFVEIGPGRTLSSLARQQAQKPSVVTSTLRHPKEEGSDLATLLAAVGRVWCGGAEVDLAKAFGGQTRHRVPLPTYPFERERYWIEPGKSRVVAPTTGALKKRADVGEWFYAPSWVRATPGDAACEAGTSWLVATGGSSIDAPLVDALRRAGDRVITVSCGRGFTRVGNEAYEVDPSRAADFEALVADLRARDRLPDRVLHAFALGERGAIRDAIARRARGPLATYADDQARAFASQAFLARALARERDAFAWITVTDGVQCVGGDVPFHPERATALGVPKVLPREMADVTAIAVDVVIPRVASAAHERLVAKLAREARATSMRDGVVAYRHGDCFVQRFDRVALDPAKPAWARERGTYLITGGLGGIGLAVADHVARSAPRARLVLVSRTGLHDRSRWDDDLARLAPDDDLARRIRAVRALEQRGAEVLIAQADVTDRDAMERVVEDARDRFGAITGVFHSAGVLDDRLLAMRGDAPTSPVLDTKVKGALVLDAVVGDEPDVFVLFSSVSSILGLPGQADYTAGNAFLDAFAEARRARRARGRTVSIDWNAWAESGMAVAAARGPRQHQPDRTPSSQPATRPILALEGESATQARFGASLNRAHDWIVGEHVVRGGDALVPGTGLLEMIREALERAPEDRPLEIRDVVFLAPFAVAPTESRAIHVVVERGATNEVTIFRSARTRRTRPARAPTSTRPRRRAPTSPPSARAARSGTRSSKVTPTRPS